MKFKWSAGSHLTKFNPNIIGQRLQVLTTQHGDQLTAQQVVDDARSKQSPLHPLFDWDNAHAADAYRLAQARHLIRHLRIIVVKGDNKEHLLRVRTFLRSQEAYVPHARILKHADLWREALQGVVQELQAIERKYAEYQSIIKHVATARIAIEQELKKK